MSKESNNQIKSKKRVKDFAEVFTAQREVKAMLDLTGEMTLEKTFLEPSCGTGNFLIEILQRKIALVKDPEVDYYTALGSIYAIELQVDNLFECQQRMLALIPEEYKLLAGIILMSNLQQGSFIDGQTFQFNKWKFEKNTEDSTVNVHTESFILATEDRMTKTKTKQK